MFCTKAVVAICVSFVPSCGVGAVGVPVKEGDAVIALKAIALIFAVMLAVFAVTLVSNEVILAVLLATLVCKFVMLEVFDAIFEVFVVILAVLVAILAALVAILFVFDVILAVLEATLV